MSVREEYKKKAEAEVELAQVRLAEFKDKVKASKADAHVTYAEQVDHLEKRLKMRKRC